VLGKIERVFNIDAGIPDRTCDCGVIPSRLAVDRKAEHRAIGRPSLAIEPEPYRPGLAEGHTSGRIRRMVA
jgi:hypothetical protein